LVIRGGAIGDFILTLPVLAALRAQFPGVPLEVLGYAHIAQLALAGELADNVRSIESRSMASFFARDGSLSEEMCDYFDQFALIVSFLYDPDEIFRENVARCTRAQFIQGAHRPDDSAGIHATDVFLKALERLAIFDADPTPRLFLNSENVAALQSDFVALHPGSGGPRKNWPEERWGNLIEALSGERDVPLLLIGGEAEGDRVQRLAARSCGRVEIAQNLSLPELAQRLSRCRFFVGHDSGITHLAAAVGLPGLVLWGESAEAVWRPRSEKMSILRAGNNLAGLDGGEVLERVKQLLREPLPRGWRIS